MIRKFDSIPRLCKRQSRIRHITAGSGHRPLHTLRWNLLVAATITMNFVDAAGLPAGLSVSQPGDPKFHRTLLSSHGRENKCERSAREPAESASQITFFQTEITVKLDIEWGPVRAPARAKKVLVSHGNTSKLARWSRHSNGPIGVCHRETFENISR